MLLIHKFFIFIDPALVGSIMGGLLLVPFMYYIYDVEKNPDKYKEH